MKWNVTEKCKSYKIYWRKCDVYVFSQEDVYKWAKYRFVIMKVEKTFYEGETHWLSSKE